MEVSDIFFMAQNQVESTFLLCRPIAIFQGPVALGFGPWKGPAGHRGGNWPRVCRMGWEDGAHQTSHLESRLDFDCVTLPC